MSPLRITPRQGGTFLVMLIFSLGAILFFRTVFANTSNIATSVLIGNGTPIISGVVLNNGSDITLIANTTTTVTASYTVTDLNGCGDVFLSGTVTSTLYRSGVSSACTLPAFNANTLNCYVVSTSTHNCSVASTTSANATTTFQLYYFAEATDASSSFASQNWLVSVVARDSSSATGTATSTGVELLTLNALHVTTSSINYGTLSAAADTGSTNQETTVKNAGNSSTTLNLSGNALTSGANSIPTSSQHYATSTFTYGGNEQAVQATPQAVSGFGISRPVLSGWRETTALPNTWGNVSAVAYGGYAYLLGGTASGSISSSVIFAPLSPTGSIGTWTLTTPLPNSLFIHSSVAHRGYIYVVGGKANSGITSTVWYAAVNATGSIGAWAAGTPLPSPNESHSVAVHNDYIYSVGGYNDVATITSSVWYASLSSTGTIGTWTATTPLPTGRDLHTAIVHNNYLYVIGGEDAGFTNTSTVLFAPIHATGSIGSWVEQSRSLMAGSAWGAVADHGAAASDGVIYVPGTGSANGTTSVVFAIPGSDGRLGAWSNAEALPAAELSTRSGVFIHNGYLYKIAGNKSVGYSSGTYVAALNTKANYWGLAVPNGTPQGAYSGTVTFTSVFQP